MDRTGNCENGTETCFLCHNSAPTSALLKCEHPGCGKYYHKACKRELPRVKPDDHGVNTATGFVCPRHVCAATGLPGTEQWPLVSCTRCPLGFHAAFLPAGCGYNGGAGTVCPRHTRPEKHPSVNACMVCDAGGDLVVCDTCPGAFHRECVWPWWQRPPWRGETAPPSNPAADAPRPCPRVASLCLCLCLCLRLCLCLCLCLCASVSACLCVSVCVCVCLCLCGCVAVWLCLSLCLSVSLSLSLSLCLSLSLSVSISLSVFVPVCLSLSVCLCLCVCVCVCVCVCICLSLSLCLSVSLPLPLPLPLPL